MSNSRYIILIAVGPVQTFIAAARKLRDLWFGSDMLSELSKCVARSLADQGCELIFPSPLNASDLAEHSQLLVANKVLALSQEISDPERMVEKTREDFDAFFRSRFEAAKSKLGDDFSTCIDGALFNQQRPDIGEFYAVWTPFDAAKYKESREQAEALLASRKTVRNFIQPGWDGSGRKKSSLDGVRESVLDSGERSRKKLIRRFLLNPGEELDAIGLVKRCARRTGQRTLRFESLTSLALGPYLQGIRLSGKAEIVDQISRIADGNKVLRGILTGGNESECFDFLHSEWVPSVRDDVERNKLGLDSEPDTKRRTLAALEQIEASVSALHRDTCQPGKYAAILHGDGDYMGKAINDLANPHDHRKFSEQLAEFASAVKTIVEAHEGCLIYSGGDDVLACLPLHLALKCAKKLRDDFAAKMSAVCIGAKPTFSAGLAIVHHREALSDGLELAKGAERAAKNRYGRDALAVILSKRSGSDLTVGGRWDVFLPWLHRLLAFHKDDLISSKLAYDLNSSLKRQRGTWKWDAGKSPARPISLAALEAARVIRHKGETAGGQAQAEAAEALIKEIANRSNGNALPQELVLSREIARSIRMSKGVW